MTKREMGLFWFFFFFFEKLLVWVYAHVYCFGLVLDCAVLVIQRKMRGERVDRVVHTNFVKDKSHDHETV